MIYNDIDSYCCQWLRNLIAAGHLPDGNVIEGDFREIAADDIPETAHFFAGIGGWPYALKLAGWQGPVWTASLPCQPLSSAGQRRGHNDERHVWPAFYALIAKCRPATIFGEQVASKDGREWFAGIRHDLESLGYACGGADLPAASVGAPHGRPRIFWVAHALRDRSQMRRDDTKINGKSHKQSARRSLAGGRSQALWTNGVCQPPIQLLAYGVSNRVGRLRAYGNAIVPQVAAEFVRAVMDV